MTTRNAFKMAVIAGITLMTLAMQATVADEAPAPRGVSPGSAVVAEPLAGLCPTFSWSGVEQAAGYELVLYRVTDGDTLETVVQTQIAGDARGWTPSAAQCPTSGNQYAWAVRALGDAGAGAWSEPLLFKTPGTPTEDEVRQALATLRRYREGREGDVGEGPRLPSTPARRGDGLAPSLPLSDERDPSGTELSDNGARRYPGEGGQDEGGSDQALTAPTLGSGPSPQAVTPPSSFSLTLSSDVELGGFVFKDGVPFLHNDGGAASRNTALGLEALTNLTDGSNNTAVGYRTMDKVLSGDFNTALGSRALQKHTANYNTAVGFAALYGSSAGSPGEENTAVGARALQSNIDGSLNTAIGHRALFFNTTGHRNTAMGARALKANTTGLSNTAVGQNALYNNTTGRFNTAIGEEAGFSWTTGKDNIAIGADVFGLSNDSGVIRIGGLFQTKTFIAAINDATGTFDTVVCITGADQLGPCSASSKRFKQDVKPLDDLHQALSNLRPVSFRYQPEFAGEPDLVVRYGFIAEEVAEILPSLVTTDDEGRPHTVRYDLLTPLLLAEIQRHEAEISAQNRQLESVLRQIEERDRDHRQELADLQRRLDRLAKKKRFR